MTKFSVYTSFRLLIQNTTFNVPWLYHDALIHTHIQTQPVSLTVYAQVTSSDIEFSTPNLDFGSCTVHESVVATIHLTNKSILPQQFGFINLPEVQYLVYH